MPVPVHATKTLDHQRQTTGGPKTKGLPPPPTQHAATMRPLTTTLLALAATSSTLAARKTPADAVLLSNIKTLTLHNGRQTTARRGPSVPQLECVGGNARGLHSVDVMRCTNAGADYDPEDVQWTCQASLPTEFKLGSTEVVCEGY